MLIEVRNSESYRPARVKVRTGSLRDWHERLSHVHVDAIRNMANIGAVGSLKIDSDEKNVFREPCMIAKRCHPSHQKSERRRNRRPVNLFTQICAVDLRRVH